MSSVAPVIDHMLTRRSSRLLRCLLGACCAAAALAIAAPPAGAYIYWGTFTGLGPHPTGPIGRANLDGTGITRHFIPGAKNTAGVAVDARHVYWTSVDGTIGRANLDGTGVDQRFIVGPSNADAVAVDPAHIYWSNGNGAIGRANLDGTGIDQQFITGLQGAYGIAVDGAHIYWVSGASGTIGRANLDGTAVNQSFLTGATDPGDLAVDGAHIYWTNGTQNSINTGVGRANLDGTGVTNRFIDALPLGGVAVDGTHIYWSNQDGSIGRANLNGTGVDQHFIVGVGGNGGIAVDSLGPTGGPQPRPVFGKTASLAPVSGQVLVRVPGGRGFVPLSSVKTVPLGSVVDTTAGKVRLTSVRAPSGGTQSGLFYDGVFRVTQMRARSGVRGGQVVGLTVLSLAGPRPSGCASTRHLANIAGKRPKKRRLWGNATGNFRTVGGSAAATVRGTEWLTEDTCAGTLVQVVRGVVSVDDFVHHRTVLVHAGHSYLAQTGGQKPATSRGRSTALLWAALGHTVRCGIAAHPPNVPQQLLCAARVVPAPKQGNTHEGDPGFVFLRTSGPPQLARLSQYSWQAPNAFTDPATLKRGQTWSRGGLGVKCAVTTDTVRCANRSNHGFAITLSTYRQF